MNPCDWDPVRDAAEAWAAAGRAAVVVTVVEHQGSVPRESGTRMLVAADAVVGTIGGGHLELQALETARSLLLAGASTGPARRAAVVGEAGAGPARVRMHPVRAEPVQALLEHRIALGPSLGQCCGGALVLRYTALAADVPSQWAGPRPRFTLHLFGAGHVGRAIVKLLAAVPCRVRWVDERESEFPAVVLPPHIERVCADPVQAEVAAAAAGDAFLVLTHSHDLDLAITRDILARGDFGFFGLIGSATKRARFERRLAERGVAPDRIARMTCPIGLPGLRGKEPGVIAVAVVAQLLLVHPG
jgi:xanthine dehydrogenase accessory factor